MMIQAIFSNQIIFFLKRHFSNGQISAHSQRARKKKRPLPVGVSRFADPETSHFPDWFYSLTKLGILTWAVFPHPLRQFSLGELGNFSQTEKVFFKRVDFSTLHVSHNKTALPIDASWFADQETLKIPKWPKLELGSNSRPTAITHLWHPFIICPCNHLLLTLAVQETSYKTPVR